MGKEEGSDIGPTTPAEGDAAEENQFLSANTWSTKLGALQLEGGSILRKRQIRI